MSQSSKVNPNSEKKVNWKKTRDRGSPWLIDLIIWIILHMGRSVGRTLLFPIVLYFILTSSTRRYSKQYLRRNFKSAGKHPPGVRHLFQHYYSFANMLLDRVYFLSGRNQKLAITLHNPELIEALVRQNKGAVLLGSHLGNFDALRALASERSDIKIRALMYDNEQQNINIAFEKLNPDIKADVIHIGQPEAMLQVQEDIQQGYLIGMLGDRVEQDSRTVSCEFLGETVSLPSGPLIVAHLLKAPVILCFALHRCGNQYDIYFHLLTEQVRLNRNRRETQIQALMQQYMDTLASHALTYPYNWYNFYDYWKDYE
jgi:predicted LPLAT superfamily acyltransferase